MALIPWKGLEKCTNQPVTSPSGFSKCQGRNAFKIAFQGSTSDTVAWLWGGEERDNTPGSFQRTCDGHQVLELPHLFVGKETPLPTKVRANNPCSGRKHSWRCWAGTAELCCCIWAWQSTGTLTIHHPSNGHSGNTLQ